jgi:outer membrane lipoprotein-sorting protein
MFDRHRLTALVLAAVLVGVGGIAPPPTGQSTADAPAPDPDRIVTELSTGGPSSFEGRLNETVKRNGTVVESTTYDVVDRPDEAARRVTITDEDGSKITLVRNDSTAWIYDASAGTFSEIGADGGGFVVPALRQGYYEDLFERFDSEYAGTERVAGREAHVVVFSDPDAENGTASIDVLVGDRRYRLAERRFDEPLAVSEYRLWIDREHAHPLKERTTLSTPDGESVVFTDRYERIEFGTDPEPETFTFDPPPEAERERPRAGLETERFDSIAAADESIAYPVPDPTVPEGYALETVYVTHTPEAERVSVQYRTGSDRLVASVRPEFDRSIKGASVDVGGRSGALVEHNGETSLYWDCADRRYSVRGPHDAEELLAVAESIDCRP